MKLVLHNYWRSSASHRVRIGLGLKNLAYDYVAVDLLHHANEADTHRAKNPMAQVPVLEITEDDGTVTTLLQSLPILEYLDERWPDPPLLPRDRTLRARARALAEVINSGIQPFQNLPTLRRVKALGGDEQAWAREHIAAGLAAFQRMLPFDELPFCAGDGPTIADCCLIPQLVGARRFGVDLSKHDRLLAIEARCNELPAFANAAPDKQPDARA